MKPSWNNPFPGLLRNKAGEHGDGAGDAGSQGLMSGLDNFIDTNPDATATGKEGQQTVAQVKAEENGDDPPPVGTTDDDPPPTSTKEPDAEPTSTQDDDDLDLPTIGKVTEVETKDDDKGFDEAAFDAETAAVLKKMEEDGHPGDVYKDLRGKLKEFESGSAQNAEQSARIAELEKANSELQEKADGFDAMKTRADTVSKQHVELVLQESPEWESKVVKPYNEIEKTIDAMGNLSDKVSVADIRAAVQETDFAKRENALVELEKNGLSARHVMHLERMNTDLRQIALTRKDMMDNAEKIVAESRQASSQQDEAAAEKLAEDYKQAASASFENHAKKIPGFTDEHGRLTDAGRLARATAFTVDFNQMSTGDAGYMVFTAQALPAALSQVRSLQRENRELRVAAGKAGERIPAGGAIPKKDAEPTTPDGKPMGLLDHMGTQEFTS